MYAYKQCCVVFEMNCINGGFFRNDVTSLSTVNSLYSFICHIAVEF